MQELRQEYAASGGLSAVLRRHGLEEEELEASIRMQISILRFVDLRFRPFAGVSTEEMEAYYQQKLIPQLQASRSVVPPFEDLANKIKEVLREEKVTFALEQWLKEAKQRSNIEFFTSSQDSDGRSDGQVARRLRPVLGERKP